MCARPPALTVGDMPSTAIEVHDLHNSYDGQLEPRALLRKPYGTVSGEHRQRLFLDFALVKQPRIVFLAELTQVDPVARRETRQLTERAHAQGTADKALSERRYRAVGRW